MRDDADPLADLIELQPAWVKTFDLPGGDGAHWTIFPNSDSVEIRAEVVQPTVNVWSLGVWYWPEALAVVLALLVLATGRWWWFARRGKEPRCRKCGYELTGLKSEACPECGTALTPRNRVTGLRSRRRMAIAPVALLIIGGAWWFGESHAPRHGWVSEKVQWHWAVHRDSIGPPGLFYTYRWYVLHGGERVSRISIDAASGDFSTTSSVQFTDTQSSWLRVVDLDDEMRAWGRFVGSESIWEIDADRCRVTKHGPNGSETFALPFCAEEIEVLYEHEGLGAGRNYLTVCSRRGDEWIGSYPFLPDPAGDAWFIVADDKVIHLELATGNVVASLDLPSHAFPEHRTGEWTLFTVSGDELFVVACDLECFLIDLASMKVLRLLDQWPANEISIELSIAGHEEVVVDNVLDMGNGALGTPVLTADRTMVIGETDKRIVAGSIAHRALQYHLVEPPNVTPRSLEAKTTGPGPRDVNVLYIDGDQLILAVYELPEAE